MSMTKITLKEIKEYIDNEVKDGRVQIGFEDVNGDTSDYTYVIKRPVAGFMLIKSDYSTTIRSVPIFCVGEGNDVNSDIEDYEKLVGVIPSNCFAVFCLVPKNERFEKVKSKPYEMKSLLLGYEYPNCEHPDWIEEYKKEFVNSFESEKLRSIKKTNSVRKPSMSIEDILNECED